jgi:hypothetical protein
MSHSIAGTMARTFRVVGLLIFVAAVSSCRKPPKTAGGPYGEIIAKAVPAVEQAVGLRFKTPPKIEVRSKEQVRDYVLQQLQDSATMREIAGQSSAYKLLGMIPDSLDLPKLMTSLLEEQIVGFYDPKTKVLYIVQGSPKESAELIVTHELVHALQDQYVSLDSIQKPQGNNDRQSAIQAVFEGEAVYEQIHAMLGPTNIAVAMPGGWDRVRETIRNNQSAMPVYASAPMVIQETLIFPYLSGAEFIKNFRDRKPGKIPFNDLPSSTAQIIHQDEFFGKRVEPTPVSFAPVSGVTPTYRNNLGEFETRLYLYQHLNDVDQAAAGATGWNGDQYIVFNTAKGPAIAWATVWLTPQRAASFHTYMERATDARRPAESGRSEQLSIGYVNDKTVVLFVDTPVGVASPIKISDIRVGSTH